MALPFVLEGSAMLFYSAENLMKKFFKTESAQFQGGCHLKEKNTPVCIFGKSHFSTELIETGRKTQYNITIDMKKAEQMFPFCGDALCSRGKGGAMATVLEDGVSAIPREVLGDDLVDVRPLGQQGGFSNLFRAHKVGLDVDVVIKRVQGRFQGRLDQRGEARIMTALRHQYLPRIYDLKLASDGFCYTIMEFVEGCTLREYVRREGALDQKLTLKWVRQLCEVTEYMHTRRPPIIHSDLKPENVMITPQGDICVIDFNASLEAREEGQEAIGASSGFAAPEQYNLPPQRFPAGSPLLPVVRAAQGYGKVTPRTDLYAIGALGYYMLTGYDPAVWCAGVTPLTDYDIQLGDAFRQVLERAMAPKQSERFSSAGEMLRALNNLSRLDARYRRWVRQTRIAGLCVGLCLSLGVLGILLGLRTLEEENRGNYLALVEQGSILRQQQQYAQSQQVLLEAVALDQSRIEAYSQLAALLYQQGEYQQAIDLLEGVEFHKADAMTQEEFEAAQGQIRYLEGNCFYRLEQYQQALESYQLAVWLTPDQPEYQRELAICYARTGNQKLAEETVAVMESIGAKQEDLALTRGEIAYAYGEYDQALPQLMAAAQGAGDPAVMGRAYIQAANCCMELGRTDEEIAVLEEARDRLGAASNSVQTQMLSEALLRKANEDPQQRQELYQQALSLLEELLAKGYVTFTVEQNTAVVLQVLDRYEEAEALLMEMEQRYPGDYRVPMRLALLYGDLEGSRETDQRDYSRMAECWSEARRLYQAAGVQDSEMIRLEEMVAQLEQLGWDLEEGGGA